jgi:RNA recognition motif-containing protein
MNIFVGNLSFEAKEIDVQRVFSAFGLVISVAIVMEKKGKKSRGFGFVEMPDEQEALAAIAQLQGKEILGRPINVTPALSKGPKSEPVGKRNKYSSEAAPRHDPSFVRTGKYKEGRRSLSYLKQRIKAGVSAPVTEHKYKSNPMRWRKKPRSEAYFAKPEGEAKPWQKHQTESNPWKKPKSSPWKKAEGEFKPWDKSRDRSKPWIKSENSEAKPWQRAKGVVFRPWQKADNVSGSRKREAGKANPWRKKSADRAQPGFKKRSRFSKSHRE